MSLKNIGRYVNDRLSLFVGIGLIISIHWGWYKVQQVPAFVKESERKELPIVQFAQYLKSKVANSIGTLPESNSTGKAKADIE